MWKKFWNWFDRLVFGVEDISGAGYVDPRYGRLVFEDDRKFVFKKACRCCPGGWHWFVWHK